jgi:PAT family beta-lactamase induction signal transducer AmpG
MLYMMYFFEGKFVTAHYAICTAFMALSNDAAGMVAGYLQEQVGYEWFFWIVMLCCVATVVMTFLVRQSIDADYGRKQQH